MTIWEAGLQKTGGKGRNLGKPKNMQLAHNPSSRVHAHAIGQTLQFKKNWAKQNYIHSAVRQYDLTSMLTINSPPDNQSAASVDNQRNGASLTSTMLGWEGVGVDTGHLRFIRALYHAAQNHPVIERPRTE